MKTLAQTPVSVEVEQLDSALKTLLGQTANELAVETKFIRRQRELTGGLFAQALIFGWLQKPDASYTQLQEILAALGCEISPQALEQRMTHRAADFLSGLLYESMSVCVGNNAVLTEVLSRFEGVYLQDGSVISLPNEMEGLFKGCGGSTDASGRSAIRVQVRLNLANGALQGPWIQPAVACERDGEGSEQRIPLPVNGLWVVDSHYPTLKTMKQLDQEKKYWITHMKADMVIFNKDGVKQTLPQWIAAHEGQDVIDERVQIGSTSKTRQSVRLVAFRVSDCIAQRRREQVNERSSRRAKGARRDVRVGKKQEPTRNHGRKRHHPGCKRIELLEWSIMLTNVPLSLLSAPEVRAIMRARWQIELLWRLWKERGQIDIWRSEKPMRILCEIYAKLLAMVIQHWVLLLGCWQAPDRSMVKASLAVQMLATSYALTLAGPISSVDVLRASHRAMHHCRLNHSTQRHSTALLLEQPSLAKGLT